MDAHKVEHVGLLLAAGAGARFGGAYPGAKLDQLVDGVAVGVRAFDTLAQGVDAMIVVVRSAESALAKYAAARGASVLINPAPERGLASSLAIAADHAITTHINAQFAWAYLADMPYLEKSIKNVVAPIKTSVESKSSYAIFQPIFVPLPGEISALSERARAQIGKPGHPVVFGRAHWAALAALEGDLGARSVIESQRQHVVQIPIAHEGIWRDVDLPEHLHEASAVARND